MVRIWFAGALALITSLGCSPVGPSDQSATRSSTDRPSPLLTDPLAALRTCPFPWLSLSLNGKCISLGANDPTRIVRFRPGAPQLMASEVSFYAVRGKTRAGALSFGNGAGGRGGDYVTLTIPAGALVNRPNGTPIAMGDSVLITIRALSTERMLWEFLPEGLIFNSSAPARAVAFYREGDHDFDGDGDQDLFDFMIETNLGIWRAPLGQLFALLASTVDLDIDRVSADVPGFSRLGIAY